MTVSLSCFFAGKKSTASAHLHTLTICLQQNCLSTPRTSSGRSFLLLKALIFQQTPLKQVQTEFSGLCQKCETGKLNVKQ